MDEVVFDQHPDHFQAVAFIPVPRVIKLSNVLEGDIGNLSEKIKQRPGPLSYVTVSLARFSFLRRWDYGVI